MLAARTADEEASFGGRHGDDGSPCIVQTNWVELDKLVRRKTIRNWKCGNRNVKQSKQSGCLYKGDIDRGSK